jgi:two-component SAPR family response regulator
MVGERMKIIAVDNHIGHLARLKNYLVEICSCEESIVGFTDPLLAVKYCVNNNIDILFTEVDMRGIDGFTLINLIRKYNSKMVINIVTQTNEYQQKANECNVSRYILKPVSIETLKDILEEELKKY